MFSLASIVCGIANDPSAVAGLLLPSQSRTAAIRKPEKLTDQRGQSNRTWLIAANACIPPNLRLQAEVWSES